MVKGEVMWNFHLLLITHVGRVTSESIKQLAASIVAGCFGCYGYVWCYWLELLVLEVFRWPKCLSTNDMGVEEFLCFRTSTTITCMQLQCYVTANRNQTLEPDRHKTDTNFVWAKNEIFQYFRCFFSSADFYVLSYDWLAIRFLITETKTKLKILKHFQRFSIFILQCLVAVIVYVS